ncbi:MAG: glycosyl transferase [Ignavibacteriales bacterium CG_4_9_14_3_um_filter_34_10]|nr:MAG: glycosyl transferase [Ignavibacteriales bacterium CG_4_9_14_3_um_filter_34_10]
MRILQINNNHFRKSGTDSVYLNLISLLRDKGHEVIPFSFEDSNNVEEINNKFFIKKSFWSKSFGKFYSHSARKQLEKLITETKPDIAHFHNIIGGISLSILPVLKKHKIPTVVTMHGFKYLCPAYVFIDGKGKICEKCKTGKYINCFLNTCAPEGKLKSLALSLEAYARDLIIPFYKYIDRYIFLSDFYLKKYAEFYPEIASKGVFFYNFINELKENTEINTSNRDYFLFFGRLDREKGVKTLVSAFSKLPQAKLKIVGTGELTEYVLKNSTSNIEYLGYKNWNELKELIKNSSFIIIPSECYENNPMTIIESYSLGKPVIGSKIGGIPEIVWENETGFLFEMGNVEMLVTTIKKAIETEDNNYSKMSENSFKFATDNFSTELYYQKLIEVYSSLIN